MISFIINILEIWLIPLILLVILYLKRFFILNDFNFYNKGMDLDWPTPYSVEIDDERNEIPNTKRWHWKYKGIDMVSFVEATNLNFFYFSQKENKFLHTSDIKCRNLTNLKFNNANRDFINEKDKISFADGLILVDDGKEIDILLRLTYIKRVNFKELNFSANHGIYIRIGYNTIKKYSVFQYKKMILTKKIMSYYNKNSSNFLKFNIINHI